MRRKTIVELQTLPLGEYTLRVHKVSHPKIGAKVVCEILATKDNVDKAPLFSFHLPLRYEAQEEEE